MLSFLLSIVIFVLFLALFVILFFVGFVRSLFGLGRKKQNNTDYYTENQNSQRKKIFDDQEGEYVDFEEIDK